jgi:2-keto-4-pentenoate hydratase
VGDERIERGLRAQLARLEELIADGHEHLGWKIGLNAAPVIERMETDAPVIGFLTSATLVEEGDEHSLAGGTAVAAEAEVAIHLASDVPAGADAAAGRAAIGALGAAIELVDLDRPLEPDRLEEILADNVFHRGVVLGPPDPSRAGGSLEGVTGRIVVNGSEEAMIDMAEAAGDLGEVVEVVAARLDLVGAGLRAGDRIIAGALPPRPSDSPDARRTPWLPVAPGDEVEVDLGRLGGLALSFSA